MDCYRLCAPSTLNEWKNYYYLNVRPKEHIDSLGEILYNKIKNELPDENRFHPILLSSINKQDCIDYMHLLVINRTFDGYMKEHGK